VTGAHHERVAKSFSDQAAAFEDRRYNTVFTEGVDWLFARLRLRPDDLLLDVAAGTGHAARALAPGVRGVIALDATPAMLEAGKRAAEQAGLRNIVFQRGDAAALPFVDASFDIVVSRFAVHHFEDPAAVIGEIGRCLRGGGALVVADLVADDDPLVAATQDRLERLRDPSQTRTLPQAELVGLIEAAGNAIEAVERRDVERPLAPWLEQTRTTHAVAAVIAGELHAELAGGPATGFHPRALDDGLHFRQRFVAVTATRPG
jgi:ubiquinone/menaquinone biosynthesis C-methylase UbiE